MEDLEINCSGCGCLKCGNVQCKKKQSKLYVNGDCIVCYKAVSVYGAIMGMKIHQKLKQSSCKSYVDVFNQKDALDNSR